MGLLDVDDNPYPSHLTLDQQGIFVLGYYHQRTNLYKPRNENATDEEDQSTIEK